jgi:rare lipoprotein A (peptidoglycan hydrolase)
MAIDLSEEAARELGIHEVGIARVEMQVAQNVPAEEAGTGDVTAVSEQ